MDVKFNEKMEVANLYHKHEISVEKSKITFG